MFSMPEREDEHTGTDNHDPDPFTSGWPRRHHQCPQLRVRGQYAVFAKRGSAHFAKRSYADTKAYEGAVVAEEPAPRCMNSSGLMTRCVVPSRHGVLSFSSTCPAALSCTR
jgi:hypothetical protein